MARRGKKKLTPGQRRAKKRRKAEFETIFVNGKQKRVRRAPTVEGLSEEEFVRRNADPIWLHQNERWEEIETTPIPNPEEDQRGTAVSPDGDIPF